MGMWLQLVMLTSSPGTTTSRHKTQVRLVGGVHGSCLVLLVKRKFLFWWIGGESDECLQSLVVLLPSCGERGKQSHWESAWVQPWRKQALLLNHAVVWARTAPPLCWKSSRVRVVDVSMAGWVCVTSDVFRRALLCKGRLLGMSV